MEDTTRNYLQGRFKDYYRRNGVELPPNAEKREWGFVPWTAGVGEIFERHKSLLDVGDMQEYLKGKGPKHVYFSSSKYERPSAKNMESKNWIGADLIFDIDAKDLESVGKDTTYRESLQKAQNAIIDLLNILEDEFRFEDIIVTFSGGQGFHIHVMDDRVQQLEGPERGEIVNYIRGNGFNPASIGSDDTNLSSFLTPYVNGWSREYVQRVSMALSEARDMEKDDFVSLGKYEEMGDEELEVIWEEANNNYGQIILGRHKEGGVTPLLEKLSKQLISDRKIEIDEPVTTDVNRLIRFPGSLHGGTGFKVTRIPRDELEEFDPFTDAVPETFTTNEIKIEVKESGTYSIDDYEMELDEGETEVPESLGIYLMAQGIAEKLPE